MSSPAILIYPITPVNLKIFINSLIKIVDDNFFLFLASLFLYLSIVF